MAGILNFDQYLGGADQIKIEQAFPSTQKTLIYDFGFDVSTWTFELDHQTIVVDTVAFNRNTGQPNFSNSKVIGSFPRVDVSTGNINYALASTGKIYVTFPANMYTGAIVPDARLNVPITVLALTWDDNASPAQIQTHRWALVQCWEPSVTVGNPVDEATYTALGV
jgi:hypothetical protein